MSNHASRRGTQGKNINGCQLENMGHNDLIFGMLYDLDGCPPMMTIQMITNVL